MVRETEGLKEGPLETIGQTRLGDDEGSNEIGGEKLGRNEGYRQ